MHKTWFIYSVMEFEIILKVVIENSASLALSTRKIYIAVIDDIHTSMRCSQSIVMGFAMKRRRGYMRGIVTNKFFSGELVLK